jgi:hypothetical protein
MTGNVVRPWLEELKPRVPEEIFYWAPVQARQTEVDFLLRRGRDYLALEIKAQSRFSSPQLSGLRAIAALPHGAFPADGDIHQESETTRGPYQPRL